MGLAELCLEILNPGDQLLHVDDRPDEDLEFEFLLLGTLLSLGTFLILVVCFLAKAGRDERAKGVEGLVYLCTTGLLDAGVVLSPKRVACGPGDFSRLPGATLCLGSERENSSLTVVRIVVSLELVRL